MQLGPEAEVVGQAVVGHLAEGQEQANQASPVLVLQDSLYCLGKRKTLHILCSLAHALGSAIISAIDEQIQNNFCMHTIVPNVINPTREFGGRSDKLMTKESFKAFKLSSSWQVSTTYTKMGGAGAGRAS